MAVSCSRAISVFVFAALVLPGLQPVLRAQDESTQAVAPAAAPGGGSPVVAPPSDVAPTEDKYAFGVLPNYRTTEESIPFQPITTKQKFYIATKDTINFPAYTLAGFFAGVSQLNNSNPSFGQGLQGYAKRYISGVADQDIGNFMTAAIMPSLLHEDPRYFRKGHGSIKGRIWYAATRVAVAKTDAGNATFNFAEFIGNGTVAAIGNAYYPDEKGFSPTMQRMFTQIGTDAISQVLKEFWPDVKRKFFNKKNKSD
jgi:hypothetical protein